WETVSGKINIGAPELIWGSVDSPADASGSLYLCYDADFLYGYFEANDDFIETKSNNWWENDDIDFKLDLNPLSNYIPMDPSSWEYPSNREILSIQFTAEAGYSGSSSGTPHTFIARSLTGTGYAIEFAIPFSEIRNDLVNPPETFSPSLGSEIGALVEMIDQDLQSTREAQMVYGHPSANTNFFWRNVQQLGHMRFLADNQIEMSRENIAAPYPPVLIYTNADNDQVTLKWYKNTEPDLLRYRIYYGTNPNLTSLLDSSLSDANDTAKVISGLIPGTVYYFRITAVDSAGRESGFSNEISVPKSLIVYYPFNGNTNDESGHGINALNNGAVLAADRFGNAASAYSFDGISNYIHTDADLLPSSERSISLWFYTDDVSCHPALLGYGGGQCGSSFIMVINNGDGTGGNAYEVQGHCRNFSLDYYYPAAPCGLWHHWVATTSAEGTKFYLDNIPVASNNLFINNTNLEEKDLSIGCAVGNDGIAPIVGDPNLGYFKGLLDDISIYNYALNEDEINSLYHERGWAPLETESEWIMNLSVSDAGPQNGQLSFGQNLNASDGIDPSLGEEELPPLPPVHAFDTRFILPGSSLASYKDLRNSSKSEIVWTIQFQPGTAGFPMSFSWDPDALPAGSFYLKDLIDGSVVNIDMHGQSSYMLTNSGISSLKIEFGKQIYRSIDLIAGWNMISLPTRAADMSKGSLFPSATSSAFGFENQYVIFDQLETGKGYWLRFTDATSTGVSGVISPDTVHLQNGWNMIGVFEFDLPASQITSEPPGIITSNFFGFNGGYFTTATLETGKGYWVKANNSGKLLFNRFQKSTSQGVLANVPENWGKIILRDKNGSSATLYSAEKGSSLTFYDLPPMPPAGCFDVRFSSNRFAEIINSPKDILISSSTYPLSLKVQNTSLRIKDKTTGKIINTFLKDGQELTINDPAVNVLEVSGELIPDKFELSQNYPNPFNPSTAIRFGLPVDSKVKISLFNLLGELVSIITEQDYEAGYHQIVFKAGPLASGIYFYRIEAGAFMDIKKMMILK
ncbi:MAG TPA: LamG-like jellyroll fold domain-containing protein, partial [Ignavibacteriaceae bacterium]|nr:LamG-like jellyroll fold domain-containing protein [Ignavibacteriaceae bacterium]